MKTFTKHILLLALMLFGVSGAAWALPRAPQKFTGPVSIYDLMDGDTLAPGFSLTYGFDQYDNIYFANGRYSANGTPQEGPYNGNLTDPELQGTSFTAGNIIFNYAQDGIDTLAPMVDMYTPGNAWVVSNFYQSVEGVELTLSGIEIVIDYPVQDADGNWNFLMPGADKLVHVQYTYPREMGNYIVYSTGVDQSKWYTLDNYTQGTVTGEFQYSNNIDLPFEFEYNGVAYTQWAYNTDAEIMLGMRQSTDMYRPDNDSSLAIVLMGYFFGNLDGNSYVRWQTFGTAPNRVFVIEYHFRHFYQEGEYYDMQAQLAENGSITIVYGHTDADQAHSSFWCGLSHTGSISNNNEYNFNEPKNAYYYIDRTDHSYLYNERSSKSDWSWPGQYRWYTFSQTFDKCKMVDSLTYTVTPTSITLQWQDNDNAAGVSYNVMCFYDTIRLDPQSHEPVFDYNNGGLAHDTVWLTERTGDVLTTTTATFDNLNPNVMCTCIVRSQCSATDLSEPTKLTVKTPCFPVATAELPYLMRFNEDEWDGENDHDKTPRCWDKLFQAPAGETLSSYVSEYIRKEYNYSTGNRYLFMSSSPNPIASIAILPAFDTALSALSLSFLAEVESYEAANAKLEVGYITDPTDTATFTAVETFTTANGLFFTEGYDNAMISPGEINVEFRGVTADARMAIRLSRIDPNSGLFPRVHIDSVAVEIAYDVDVTVNNAGFGTAAYTKKQLVAMPDSAHYLVRWENAHGTLVGTDNPQTVTVTSDTAFVAVFAPKPVLTINQSDGGTLEAIVPLGNAVWGDGVNNLILAHNYTADGITFTTTNEYGIPDDGQWFASSSKHIHFTSESGNFSRIEMTLTSNWNYTNWDNAEGWTVDANSAVWEGDANQVVIESCTTKVKQITFVRGEANVVASSTTPNTYYIDPNTSVTVVATPDSAHYLKNFVGGADTNSNVAVNNTFTVTADTTLTANFAAKPVLTVEANNDSYGTVAAILPGGVTAMHLTTDQIPTWPEVFEPVMEADLQPFGFVAVDSAAAAAWTGAPASGDAHLVYAPAGGEMLKVHVFRDGQLYDSYNANYNKADIYENSDVVYFTTGVSKGNLIASATPNTYYVDYNTDVTVVATPDSAHYLVNFDNDAALNSNVAVEKTYTNITADTTVTATFAAKPVLTINQTEGGTLEAIVPQGGGEETLLTTVTATSLTTYDETTPGIVTVSLNNIDAYNSNNGWYYGGSVTVEAAQGYTITRCLFKQGDKTPPVDNLAPFTATIVPDLGGGHPYVSVETSAGPVNRGDMSGITSIEVYGYQNVAANVIASSTEPNTYIIDYGTPVTVVATPDAQHYLVSFSDDDPATERNSNIAVEKTYDSVIADIPLSANFQAKPTLTLTANDGGTLTLDGVVEPGATGTTFTVPGNWSNDENPPTATDFPGFVAVSLEEASNWQPPVSGKYKLYYNIVGEVQYCVYYYSDGSRESAMETFWRKNLYNIQNNGWTVAYTTGAIGGMPAGVVSANATRDTFVVDYGTTLTVTATPDSIHYLKNFVGGADTNSNVAVNNTFTVTADTTLTANFELKPTLTLAHNDGGEMEIVPEEVMAVNEFTVPSSWNNVESLVAATDLPSDFQSVSEAEARAWQNTTGHPVYLFYKAYSSGTVSYVRFNANGTVADISTGYKSVIYNNVSDVYEGYLVRYTTVGYDSNFIASTTEPNTYYIDYNTDVTVKATPDATHYLVNFDGTDVRNDNDTATKVYTNVTAPFTSMATFNAKPTLALTSNEGGEMSLPGYTPSSFTVSTFEFPADWSDLSMSYFIMAEDLPTDFTPVTEAEMRNWNPGIEGNYIVFFRPHTDDRAVIAKYVNGVATSYSLVARKKTAASTYEGYQIYYVNSSTPAVFPAGVVSANATADTFVVNYGANVTVKATPSDTTYLVNFDNDADTNSNVAVEKTYENITEDTTSRAYFNDKPVLTLAANDTTWGKVTIPIGLVATDPTPAPTPTAVANPVITGVLMPDGSMQVTMSCATPDADIYYTTDNVTSPTCDCPAAPEYTHPITFTEPVTIKAAAYTGNGWSAVVTKTITLGYPAGVAKLTDTTYRVDYGAEVTVIADATELHHVANWVNEDSVDYPAADITYSAYFVTDPVALFPDSSTLTITVTADTTAKAIFGINSYDVFATAELDSRANVGTDTSMGHINVSFIDIEGDAQTVDPTDTIEITAQGGSLTTLVAKPHYGYLFTGWYDADADTIMTDADTLRITEAYKLEARFVPDTFEIVLTNRQPRFGTVVLNNYTQEETNSDATSVTERYAYRDSIILSVEPIYGYHFNNWNDNDTNNPRGFQLTQDTAFAAIISINRYQVHFGVADGQENYGTVEANYPVHYVCNHGYTAFFKAIAAEGYHFVEWSNGLTDDSVSFRIIQDTDMVATFAPNEYSVVALCDAEQGSTTGTDSYYFGTTATITATAEYGYHFTAWSDGDTNAERTIAIDFTHDTTVTALFAPDQYTVTVLSSDSTMGSVSGTGTYDYLTQVEIAATANEHYYFLQWNDNSTDADSATRTVTVTEDAIYTALFAADTHTLTLASNNAIMGSISLVAPAGLIPNEDGSYTIAYGTEVTVKATASNRCFELGNWGTSDTTLSTDSIYTFTMEGDLALKATFANHLFTSDTVVDVCDRFVWNGVTYTETPEVAPMRNYTTTDGCDSALVLNLTVRHSSTEDLYVSACNSYSWYEYTDMTYSQSVSHTFEGANVEGCDSIVTLYLTIGDVAITNLYVDTCDSYTWKDVTYTETPEVAPSYTYHTAANCDSIVTLYLTIGHPSAGVETIVACSAIEWHDSLYSESTNEPVWHTTNVSGCDSTVTLNLTITPEIATVETVEACDSYEWHDSVYTASTDSATYTATSIHGCDSTVTLHLTINHSNTAVETVEACNEYEWHEVVYTESTNLPTYTTTNAAGCDSTVTLNLTIKESASATETVEACDEYKWHDSTYTESTNLPTYTTEGANGCDSVTTLNLTINHSTNVTVTVTACDSYEWHDSVYTETPAEAPVYITEGSNGCDSVTTLMLTVATSGSSEETVEACDEYTWINDSTYTETPAEDPVYTIAGDNCSTTVTLHLTIKHSVESSFEDNACVGYAWSGNYYEESGVYTKTFEAENGCDSVVTLTLTVNQPVFNSIEAEACGSYEWNNQTYVASGVYRQTLEAENGCDSVVTLTLTVKQAASTSFSITVCDSYTWNDSVYTASGIYTQTFEGANGCDSTVTLNLTVNTNAGVEQTVEACDSYLWNGQTYTTSGNYSVSFTDGNNCVGDSVLHLTVNASASENVEETVCDRYTWNGNTYTASGVYTYHTSTVAGCDSTVTLTLTVNYSDSIDMSVTACDSYTWNDGDSATYTESGVYTYNYTTEGQCAGVKTLTLTINNSTTGSETVEACNYYVWKNNTYSNSGDYTFDTVNAAGCDSTVTLHLTIKYEAYTPISMTVCDSYEWNGEVYTHSGVFNQFFEAENGCDSVVGLTLTVNHSTTGSEIVSSCTAYEWNGQTYYESGVYTFDTVNAVGCDSTVSLLLNILQGVQTTVVENACDSYTWNDAVYTESGVYNQAFLALNGCDSIVTLNLTINNSVSTEQAVSSCVSYDWNNQTYTESGVYTQVLTARNGCDSTVTLTLTINQPATETVTVETCDGYDWNGVYYTVSGVYTYRTSTVAGCDSTVTLNLTVNYSDDTTLTMQGEGRITWNNEVFTESGRYERELSTVHGCDSTVTLNLSILPEGMPLPYLYNLMDVALMINHNEAGSENVHYVWYRWYRDGELVLEGPDKDSYSEGGSKLNGCYYLEVATDESLEYWVRSNTVCVGTVGIDEAEELSFTIAPNPVTYGSVVNVAVEAGNADLQGAEIHVYDVHGREVLSQKNNGYIVAELPSGMYMVRLTLSDGRTGVKRLIVR